MTQRARDVLVVDDDAGIRKMIVTRLGQLGLSTDDAPDGSEALDRVAGSFYSVILVDLMMPRVDGATFIARLIETERSATERPVVLVMTASSDLEALSPLGERIQAVIAKPFDLIELGALVRDCVDVHALKRTTLGYPDPAPSREGRTAKPPPPDLPSL